MLTAIANVLSVARDGSDERSGVREAQREHGRREPLLHDARGSPAARRERGGEEPGRPGCAAVWRPGYGTKRAQIGKASGYTHRSFRPDAVHHMYVHTAMHRPAVTHTDTWRDEKERARRAAFPQLAGRFGGGGRSWVRTTVGEADGFTDGSSAPRKILIYLRKHQRTGFGMATLSAMCTWLAHPSPGPASSMVVVHVLAQPGWLGTEGAISASRS